MSTIKFRIPDGVARVLLGDGSTLEFIVDENGLADVDAKHLKHLLRQGILPEAFLEPIAPRGRVEVVGAVNDTAAVVFEDEESNDNYLVLLTASIADGAPEAGALQPHVILRETTGFTIGLAAAPGAEKAVAIDWMIVRQPASE